MVNLEKLQELNKWWTKGDQFYIDDTDLIKYKSNFISIIRKGLLQFLAPGKIIILKGPRRSGKTILVKSAILELIRKNQANPDDIFYFSFDEIITPREMDTTIRTFLSKPHSGNTYIFLDEVQAVKNWPGVIQGLYNAGILQKTSVVITGSIAHFFDVETLPGRGTEGNVYYLRTASFRTFVISILKQMSVPGNFASVIGQRVGYTFTSKEVASLLEFVTGNEIDLETRTDEIYDKASKAEKYFVPLNKMFDLYIYSGGYPVSINAVISGSVSRPESYEEIYNYVRNDAATITKAGSGDPLKAGKAVSGIIGLVGKKVSYSKIARNLSMNKATLIDYYERLENSFVFLNIGGVKKSGGGIRESEVKKFYFSDIFMHYSAGAAQTGKQGDLYAKELVNSSYIGTIVEEIVAGHLIRAKEMDPMKLYSTYIKFYDGPGDNEIDFIYKRENDSRIGIEVKYQNETSSRDIMRVGGILDYILLTKSTEVSKTPKGLMIPVSIFLALLHASDHDL